VWLDLAASALVQVCVVVGVIFDIAPALLGATVLAWGNSVPDLLNNTAMARDGFPSMAVAACFASPLFTLLVGMGGALVYGSLLHNRVLAIPVDTPLLIMAGFAMANMVQHIVLVPTVHRYRMRVSLAVPLFLFYLLFNVMYLLATVGIIRMKAFEPAGGNAS
jgi:sodium/potassium/calcium exchanger 6